MNSQHESVSLIVAEFTLRSSEIRSFELIEMIGHEFTKSMRPWLRFKAQTGHKLGTRRLTRSMQHLKQQKTICSSSSTRSILSISSRHELHHGFSCGGIPLPYLCCLYHLRIQFFVGARSDRIHCQNLLTMICVCIIVILY